MPRLLTTIVLAATLGMPGAVISAQAADTPPVQLTLKDHHFTPDEIHLPTGQHVMLEVTNADATADEFEMRQLAIEKVIPAGSKGLVRLRPLAPGRYTFVGEFHEATAHGTIIVDPAGTPASK